MGVNMTLLSEKQICAAIELLNRDEIVILPTDTIYGLSARVTSQNQRNINSLKGSQETKPLIVLVNSLEQAETFIDLTEAIVEKLVSQEPTTVIYKKARSEETWAVRLVKRDDIKTIIDQVGPIFSTSVNQSNQNYLVFEADLSSFINSDHLFYAGKLDNKPSKIVNFIDNSQKR